MAATFEYWYSMKDSQYWFRLRENGNREIIIASTEGYKSEAGCLNGIASTKKNSVDDNNYTRLAQSGNGQYYFTLKAGNYEPVSKSEGYDSSYNRERGILNCKQEAPAVLVRKI